MEQLHNIILTLDGYVWGPVMLVLLLGTGVWLSVTLGFIQIIKLPKALSLILMSNKSSGEKGEITPFQALTTALSATVGTGNIAGVATAIASGGPGAIFWMWVTAFFGMATKYAEAVLSVHFRKQLSDGSTIGGPMYYISEGLRQKWLGVLFAIFGVFASFGIGSMAQSHSVALAVNNAFGVPKIAVGIFLVVITALVIIGGIKRIGKVTEKLVPFMAVFYIVISLILIISNFSAVLVAFKIIFGHAFSPAAAAGGFAGSMVRDAIRYGVARGVFSNEAGLGSAPIAHAAAKTDNAVKQGLIAMTGVFFDTIIICSMTALVIISTGAWESGKSSTELTALAFNSFYGNLGDWFLAIALIFFAYSTILGWSYYGEQCMKFLTGGKFSYFYKLIFLFTVFFGSYRKTAFVWDISDLFNGMMAIPNLIGLLGLSLLLRKLTKENMDKF